MSFIIIKPGITTWFQKICTWCFCEFSYTNNEIITNINRQHQVKCPTCYNTLEHAGSKTTSNPCGPIKK